ncbi:MAG TPA: AsmA family protein [Terracidiphilus sp.]|nr:AsmA family protein [Terracidiphilus sp.]
MVDDAQGRQSAVPAPAVAAGHRRILIALAAAVLVILASLFVPPMFSIGKYKARITQLISTSLGRPVRLSSVELRLLPRPGFVITDLSVAEDPAYGAEPVLHANTVTASIRLFSLLSGRLAIDTISVDEASLNIVHAGPGRWNLDPLFRTAAVKAGSVGSGQPDRGAVRLPYLEATNSRVNIKNGAEKLPFSLVNTDFELWQTDPGEWRIRLRGQPARTDLSLSFEDTGEVRLEASVHRAPELREMPVHIDLDWEQAQLGQLSRLLIGSDPGWRGDLTGNLHLDGTADAAHITTQLRASGVHRAEFAPAEPLDFDANCAFVYHYSLRSVESINCNSPLGDGRIQLTGDLNPGSTTAAKPSYLTLALDRISVGAGLDLLRTIRSGVLPDLEASGAVSGKLVYSAALPVSASHKKSAAPSRRNHIQPPQSPPGPLVGSLTVDGFELSGAGLSQPIRASKVVLEPAGGPGLESIAGSMSIPAGGDSSLSVGIRLAASGYQVDLRGPVSLARARELAHAAGFSGAAGFDGFAGDPVALDLSAAGPWLVSGELQAAAASQSSDNLTGSLTLHNVNWHADFLASHLEIAQATLHIGNGELRWDPVVFSYGSVKGSGTLDLPLDCPGPEPCTPLFQLDFGALDAAHLQTAILGVREQGSGQGSLLSSLIDRLHPSSAPPWPRLRGTVKADSLVLGPLTLRQPAAMVRIDPDGAEISSLDAGLLGGRVQLSVSIQKPSTDQDKPSYELDGSFQNLNSVALGQLIGLRWSGSPIGGSGKVEFSGYTAADIASSAKGSLHFDCKGGAIGAPPAARTSFPPELGRFDRWTADAAIANGALTLGQNQVHQAGRNHTVRASLTFADPPKIAFGSPNETQVSESKAEKR